MSYQLNKAHLLICIFAALVLTGGFVWFIFFSIPFPLVTMAMWVSAAIIIFYVIGYFARFILVTDIFPPPPEEVEESEDEFVEGEGEIIDGEAAVEDFEETPSDVMYDEPLMPEHLAFEDFADDPADDPFNGQFAPVPLSNAS